MKVYFKIFLLIYFFSFNVKGEYFDTILNNVDTRGIGIVTRYGPWPDYPIVLVKFEGQSDSSKAIVQVCRHCMNLISKRLINFVFRSTNDFDIDDHRRSISTYIDTIIPPDLLELENFDALREKLIYSSPMKEHDNVYEYAFIRSDLTYDEFRIQYGINPRIISRTPPQEGDEILFISPNDKSYRTNITDQTCKVTGYHDLLENVPGLAGYKYQFAFTYEDCISKPGLSGSIILDKNNPNIIYGINFGGNYKRNSPHKNVSFAFSNHILYDCLNDNFEFDLSLPNCKLDESDNLMRW